ncbi:MAG: beta-N-acetylhexosaminidase [Pseudomonadota bacterium]
MLAKSFISGCEGTRLSENERAFFRAECPWGLILFARNCESPDQIRALVDDYRNAVDRENAPVLIDQEGGRVQRLRPPHWLSYPSGAVLARAYDKNEDAGLEYARCVARLIADDLLDLGINVDCLPVLDVPQPGSHEIISDRAYGDTPDRIAVIGRVMSETLLAGGVLPVIKHLPGHGRATLDSHEDLPRVSASYDELCRIDFAPFAKLREMPLGMTAHIVYDAVDTELPATMSPAVIDQVVRWQIGFDGLLMTDDLSMKALGGTYQDRARGALQAGCDVVLHCNGKFDEMTAVASVCDELSGAARERAARATAQLTPASPFDRQAALEDFHRLCA